MVKDGAERSPSTTRDAIHYALRLCNAWLLTNLTLARRFSEAPSRSIVETQMLKVVPHRIFVASFGGG